MKAKPERTFGEVQASILEQLDQGILLPDFLPLLKGHQITLGVNRQTKYGPVLIMTPNQQVWGSNIAPMPNILPGDSIKQATKKIPVEQVQLFLKENEHRIMLRSFQRRYGEANCFRFYLKKLRNTV